MPTRVSWKRKRVTGNTGGDGPRRYLHEFREGRKDTTFIIEARCMLLCGWHRTALRAPGLSRRGGRRRQGRPPRRVGSPKALWDDQQAV